MRKPKIYSLLCILFSTSLFSQHTFSKGLDFDDNSYAIIQKKAKLTRSLEIIPAAYSLKQFAPTPKNQGEYGTCAAWSTAYCGRTILEAIKNGWTEKEKITSNAFSPAFLFRLLKPKDTACMGGSTVSDAFEMMKEKGSLLYKSLPIACTPYLTPSQMMMAANSKIKDFLRLFDVSADYKIKIQSVKKSISEQKPVVFGMICPPSFEVAKNVWTPTEDAAKISGGHAMCVVGYDDNKEGGVFEIQNSWGTDWGNAGYIWIRYNDFAMFTKYAFEFIDFRETMSEIPDLAVAIKPSLSRSIKPDLSGSIKLTLADGRDMPANLLISTRGLSVVPTKIAPGPLTLYRTVEPYLSGTRFRIYISNNEPAYVYSFSTDLSKEVTKIFPNEEGISAALTDKKNAVAIPDEDHYIEFDNKPGKDYLCVLYAKNAMPINEILKKIKEEQQGTFSEKIFKVIGKEMVDPKNIKFSPNEIGFSGFSSGKSVVAMLVELEHK